MRFGKSDVECASVSYSLKKGDKPMPEKKNENKPKRRTQVKELPKEEKELRKEEQKKVKGGHSGVANLFTKI
ncbi:MAG TPA: hypothetical protein VGB73_06940 [Pyrinomonadaceae bacterium]